MNPVLKSDVPSSNNHAGKEGNSMKRKFGVSLAGLMIFAVTIGFGVQEERKSREGPAKK